MTSRIKARARPIPVDLSCLACGRALATPTSHIEASRDDWHRAMPAEDRSGNYARHDGVARV
jgi:hypothetical protein